MSVFLLIFFLQENDNVRVLSKTGYLRETNGVCVLTHIKCYWCITETVTITLSRVRLQIAILKENHIRLFLKYFIYTTLCVRKLWQIGCFCFHISFTNRTDYHDKTEISFKVALNSYNPIALITPLMVT